MKKLLSILLLSISLIGYSQERVLYSELTEKGTGNSQTKYFEGALFNGVGFSFHSNGQLDSEGNYKDGKLVGFKRWYSNGQLQYEFNYKDGQEDGLSKAWFEDGQLEYESNFKDGELDGLIKWWYENGQLQYERNYKDGELDGLAKTWYDNGKLEDGNKQRGC